MKNIRILLSLLVALTITGCQKMITASINLNEGDGKESGMRAEFKEKSTLKDLFDAFSEGKEFTYAVDNEGYIVSINGKENGEFGYWEVLLNGELLDDVISKTGLNEGDVCDITYIPNESNPIVGGWEIAEVAREDLVENERQNFEKAMETVLGEEYEPVCVLATQLVSGTNYAYLCREKDGDREWIVVTVYNGLNGEVQVLNAHVLALYNLLTAENALPAGLSGGWSLREADNGALLQPEEAQAAFSQAVAAAEENLSPIALLGTQVVAGINYKVLARGENALYIVTVYAPLTGDASITDMEMLDLLAYVSVN